MFNKMGGGNVWVHIYTQSIAQIVDEIGQDTTISILDNINTWIYMLVNHPDTAKSIEKVTPQVRQFEPASAAPLTRLGTRVAMRHFGKFYYGRTADVGRKWLEVKFPEINQDTIRDLPKILDPDTGREEDMEAMVMESLKSVGAATVYAS